MTKPFIIHNLDENTPGDLREAAAIIMRSLSFNEVDKETGITWSHFHGWLLEYAKRAEVIINKKNRPPAWAAGIPLSPTITEVITHIFDKGQSMCNVVVGRPIDWPKGHVRVSVDQWVHSNCQACKAELTKQGRAV